VLPACHPLWLRPTRRPCRRPSVPAAAALPTWRGAAGPIGVALPSAVVLAAPMVRGLQGEDEG